MPETAVWLPRVLTRDGSGGQKETWPGPGTGGVPARLGHVTDAMRAAYAGQLRGKSTATLTVPVRYGAIAENDRIAVLGGTYRVVARFGPTSYETARRMLVEEV